MSSWFAADLVREVDGRSDHYQHHITAVGSSSKAKAQSFVDTHIPSAHPDLFDSYEGVYSHPDVDIVYIGTPHPFHHENALCAIRSGKHVICEKPLTMNTQEAESLVAAARENNVYLLEGMFKL